MWHQIFVTPQTELASCHSSGTWDVEVAPRFLKNFVHPWLILSSHLRKGLPCFQHKPNDILVKVNMSCMMCIYTTRQVETVIHSSQSLHL